MKEIQNYVASKYSDEKYSLVENGIYQTEEDGEKLYLTSLSFVQEPELEEGSHAGEISQYPLEDLLDKFFCHISDFYDELNTAGSPVCYLKFACPNLEDIRNLREIIGKHVYNKEINGYIELMIE